MALAQLEFSGEAIVIDHFETFSRCQDYPLGIATPIGHRSWFVYGLDPCPHARGKRGVRLLPSERQDSRGGYRASFTRSLDALLQFFPESERIRLLTDGHESYRRALRAPRLAKRVLHVAYPNPKRGPKGSPRSKEARERDAALFPNDQLHSFIRHSIAHHRRETIAFARRAWGSRPVQSFPGSQDRRRPCGSRSRAVRPR